MYRARILCMSALALLSPVLSFSWGQDPLPKIAKAGEEITNTIGMKLVYIPAGKFTMGSPKIEQAQFRKVISPQYADHADQEKQHEVHITKGFYLGKYAVTQSEYNQVMKKNPSYFGRDGGGKEAVARLDTSKFPVESVSWEEAKEFCRRLSKLEGKEYTLPTEGQWEYACRAGTTTTFHSGATLSTDQANYRGDSPFAGEPKGENRKRPVPVGSFAANGWGLHDMQGNVFQWCGDWYNQTEYDRGDCKDPTGPLTKSSRVVVRGGSWHYGAWSCRSANRYHREPAFRGPFVGFRLALQVGK